MGSEEKIDISAHSLLSRDHILTENDSVVAVIDFGDVNWGDPDYDFMYLFGDFGPAFAEDVARRYGHQDLDQLMSKLLYFGLLDQIGTILDGDGLALEGQEDLAWLRRKQLLRAGLTKGGAFTIASDAL